MQGSGHRCANLWDAGFVGTWQGRGADSKSQLRTDSERAFDFPMKHLLQARRRKKLCKKERVLQLGIDASAIYARVL